jgi:hypothetical protein
MSIYEYLFSYHLMPRTAAYCLDSCLEAFEERSPFSHAVLIAATIGADGFRSDAGRRNYFKAKAPIMYRLSPRSQNISK